MISRRLNLAAISNFFSSGVFHEMARKGESPRLARLLRESSLLTHLSACSARVADAFEAGLAVLQIGRCRDEYVYRTALTHKVLMGTHSLNTASMLTEFRVGDCKADLAILNGTATVYEIKSERDSLSRLKRQVEAYKKVFARVYVIAGENHVDAVLQGTDEDIGVMSLSHRLQISTVRTAELRTERVCPVAIFESLRVQEAKIVLRQLGVSVPDVPNTLIHSELRRCFASLAPDAVHRAMVSTLKRTRSLARLNQLIIRLPPSLHAAALSTPLRRCDHERLVAAVDRPLREAMVWA